MSRRSIILLGALATALVTAAANNAPGIIVSILNKEAAIKQNLDMPNTCCQPVTVSGLSGQCGFATVAFRTTTLLVPGKQFAMSTFGKHPDQNTDQRFVENFIAVS